MSKQPIFTHFLRGRRIRTTKAAMNMHATMMHLASCLPDWNSLDSVRRTHNDLEGVGLVFFALLVVSEALAHLSKDEKRKHAFDTLGVIFFAVAVLAEIAAYPYSQRNDTLSEQVIVSLDAKARDASTNAAKALTDSGNALIQAGQADIKSGNAADKADKAKASVDVVGKRAESVEQELEMEAYLLSAREVRDPNGLKLKLTQFKGKTVYFRSYINDGDGYFLCETLMMLAGDVRIIPVDQCGQVRVDPLSDPLPFTMGIHVFAPDDETMLALSTALSAATPFGSATGGMGSSPHSPIIVVFVGRKNTFIVGETTQTKAAIDAAKSAAATKRARRKMVLH
jgi:hypothetical protein